MGCALSARVFSMLSSVAPLAIIGGLLYAGLFIKPEGSAQAVPRPAFERGDRLYGLAVQPGGKTWLVGRNGKILSSADHSNWQYVPSPVNVALQDLAIWDDKHAVAVGDDGVVITSHDGGQSWQQVDVPKAKVANKLMRVKASSYGQAWAVGEGGVVLKTTDRGEHWALARDEEDIAWNDVFLKDGRGWIVGEHGRILVSNDAGNTWREVKSPVKSSLMAVAFRNAQEGVAVGLDGVVIVSSDGGQTWQERSFTSPDRAGDGVERTAGDVGKVYERGRADHLLCVLWDGRRWIAGGTKGVIVVGDADGTRWQGRRLSEKDRNWYSAAAVQGELILFSGSRFVASPLMSLAEARTPR